MLKYQYFIKNYMIIMYFLMHILNLTCVYYQYIRDRLLQHNRDDNYLLYFAYT